MVSKQDGGPAFPLHFIHDANRGDYGGMYVDNYDAGVPAGMTLRDYFAGQALAGLLSNYATLLRGEDILASDAYRLADAMLAERAKP